MSFNLIDPCFIMTCILVLSYYVMKYATMIGLCDVDMGGKGGWVLTFDMKYPMYNSSALLVRV